MDLFEWQFNDTQLGIAVEAVMRLNRGFNEAVIETGMTFEIRQLLANLVDGHQSKKSQWKRKIAIWTLPNPANGVASEFAFPVLLIDSRAIV